MSASLLDIVFRASAPHNAAPQPKRDWVRLDPGLGVGVKFRDRNRVGSGRRLSTSPWTRGPEMVVSTEPRL